ncbi:MAG TPA: 3-dehydroquinate synthase [Lentisphaeria bacterium]|nr:MAG: 3-dehydroquinate synthase [Lentisphaerae bacterium GWF2_49_21]HBC89188.1 3-dehydroquinate synthase [Lentisphaeria bacterium]
MHKIKVNLKERGYDILIGKGIITRSSALKDHVSGRSCLVMTDSNVGRIYGAYVMKALKNAGTTAHVVSFKAGESSKNIDTFGKMLRHACRAGLDRSSVIVALGGGVPGDVAGFVAASYMRGVKLIQIPTSLLAMVDSSVGGKTGIDLPEGKNLVGVFWQPSLVLIDPSVLKTLPKREIRCGLAEIVKYGVIMDDKFFSFLEKNLYGIKKMEPNTYGKIIARCCELKAKVVCADERETTGLRAILNYGHTFGHAIETVTGYGKFAHGEAVSIGMCMAANLAIQCNKFALDNKFSQELANRQKYLLQAIGLPTSLCTGISPVKIYKAMFKDKKAEKGKLRLVLPVRIGKVSIVKDVKAEDVMEAIESVVS